MRVYAAPLRRRLFSGSADYWEGRYAGGGTSGAGSYGVTATFKADVLNAFVADHDIDSVLEFGCGDGHQLSLAEYPSYVGLDVSVTAVRNCIEQFAGDPTKSFLAYDPSAFANNGALQADLCLSLDVVYHLVEDAAFETYMSNLFGAARRYVGIFSMNEDRDEGLPPHIRFRRFSDWIDREAAEWRLVREVPNPDKGPHSWADFYFYERDSSGR